MDAEQPQAAATPSPSPSTVEVLKTNTWKYLLLGIGAIILINIALNLGGRRRGLAPILALFIFLLVLRGIAAAILAWLHPEYLTALALGLGGIAKSPIL